MKSKSMRFLWQIKLIFLVVLVVGLFFSWHGGRGPAVCPSRHRIKMCHSFL
jgi:hypothetical protein